MIPLPGFDCLLSDHDATTPGCIIDLIELAGH
jgi:hypothetical protein